MFSFLKAKKKILVVEDEPAIRKMLLLLLKGIRCKAFEAGDGETGYELALRHVPDLIVVDIMLPGMSGVDMTRMLRANPGTRRVPILMCTARDRIDDIEKTLSAGANDYISKPLDFDRFRSKVDKLLGVR